jgi:hypothetical protein
VRPHAEMVHWWFATGFLGLGVLLLARAIVGEEIWNRRPWRRYLWPSLVFVMGIFMWPVMTFFTSSAIHMLAHGAWAQVLMLAGAAELALARGKVSSPAWRLTTSLGMLVSGGAFLVHEQQAWLFSRAAFLHHALGWTLIAGAFFPILQYLRPRSVTASAGFATVLLVVALLLYCDRDTAAIFGHLSVYAGTPHR